nr:IclR family transcriptional regulator [Brevibacillus halotolerans]
MYNHRKDEEKVQHKNKTVVKALDLLSLFLTHPHLTLAQLVELTDKPKTSVHRMVGSLEEMGFLRKDEEGRYALGLTFLQYGQLVSDRLDIRQIALPWMNQLREEMGEAVHLIMKDGLDAIYVEKLDTKHPVRLYTKVGRRSPLYAGACSRIILAFLPDIEVEEYLENVRFERIAKGTITNGKELLKKLEESRQNYYTISYSELENETVSVAAPIFDHRGKLIAGLSVAGPEVRFQPDKLPLLIKETMETAERISRALGGQREYPRHRWTQLA